MPTTREPPKRSASSYAIWLLSRREYSASELSKKLTARGYPAEEAEVAVAAMQSHGFQNDERYAEMQTRIGARRLGNRRLANALAEKGISREMVTEQLEDLEPESIRAQRLVEKYRGKPLDEALKGKIWRFLAYRGFSGDAIKAALRDLKSDASAVESESF